MIYLCVVAMGVYWTNNDFYVLADIEQYNKNKKKEIETRKQTEMIMEKSKQNRKKEKKNSRLATVLLMERQMADKEESDTKLVLNDPKGEEIDKKTEFQDTPHPVNKI